MMKNIIICTFVFLTLSSGWINKAKKLQWVDPYGRKPMIYSKWCKEHYDNKELTKFEKVFECANRSRQNVVDIIINDEIYPHITNEIDTFVQDLTNAGYSVQVHTISGMSHTELRNHLAGITHLVGAIFVGEIPVAWFQYGGEEFPHDIYFSDLNGTYTDSNGDGIYDNHTGSVAPEIWVGRIYARNLTWDNEIRLLKNYFQKNHSYRTSGSPVPERALTFIDDDWSYWGTCGLDYIYSNVTVINDQYQTIASNYRNELLQGYEWIQLCAHSSPWGHTFLYPSYQYRGTVFNYEIFTLEPHALFYNLFACSGTRFVEKNHSAGWYIFNDPYGLLAVGSTKTGSMLNFEDFYAPIGQQNKCIGEGFKDWFTLWGETSWSWFYGMNILGDPTLKPKGQTIVAGAPTKHNDPQKNTDWEPSEIIASDPESDAFPKIITNTDGLKWVVWESGRSYTNGRSEIYGAFRNTSGWSGAMNIGPMVYWDYCPVVGIDNASRPVTVWAGYSDGQYDLYYSIYTGSWSSRQLVHSSDPGYDIRPAMVKDNSNMLWVAWESRRNVHLDIYSCYFNGTSWSSAQRVTPTTADETDPIMALDNQERPWIVYARRYEDRSEIWGHYYNGSQWIESGPISGSHKHAYGPACAVDENGIIWVAWQSIDNGNPDIYTSYYNGSIWSSPIQITTDTERDLFASMTTDTSGTVWLVYQSKSGGDWNIYCAYCSDTTWSAPEIVANLAGADINPHITCSNSDYLWVVWQSYSTGNWEIMATHRPGYGIAETKSRPTQPTFNVSSTIFYSKLTITAKKPCQKINIYDVKGSLMKTLFSDVNRRAVWTPEGLPAGAYFIIQQDKNVITAEKVLFLR
jgi:hypothetical protein